ncbi:MAG: hypothetical protein FJ106_05895 [Deltaproteobacteria bacterium]|nr:hypothetical protein [Deltaproteobacteria bacterium]
MAVAAAVKLHFPLRPLLLLLVPYFFSFGEELLGFQVVFSRVFIKPFVQEGVAEGEWEGSWEC